MHAIHGFSAVALFVSSIAAPAAAEVKPGSPVPTASGTTAPVAKDKRYCVIEAMTGSRVPRKICKTRARWMDQGFDPLTPEASARK